jgi:hypothetical protein
MVAMQLFVKQRVVAAVALPAWLALYLRLQDAVALNEMIVASVVAGD